MRIPKFFRKAAAFVMAAVTVLSMLPATTAFAAGDIGTISFSMTYDSGGNAMRYNSSANIGGYTAGGTGKYRMSVDGETAFCIQPGVSLKTGNTLRRASSDAWNALSDNQGKAVGLALLYGYQGNRHNLTGSDDEKWIATQTLVWEFVTGCRESTGSYHQTSSTIYSLHFGSNYANDGARAAYDQIVSLMANHNTIPSFMSGGENDITRELAYKDGKYSLTLNDSNGVLSDFSFASRVQHYQGGGRIYPLPVPEESTKEKEHDGAVETYSSTPSISRNCATVMHLGCSIFRLRKSLSPVSMMSMS